MTLMDDIERLGHALEHGADRGDAIRELCAASGRRLDGGLAGGLLDNWRIARPVYDAVRNVDGWIVTALQTVAGLDNLATYDATTMPVRKEP